MPNRIIKESICTSGTIDELSWFEEVFFYRLMVTVDDYGRFDARPAIIRSRLFPLKTNVTDKTVEQTLSKLATVGLVSTYMVEDKPILQLLTWEKHQTIRNQRSKYPGPDEADCNQLQSIDFNCLQVQSNVPVIQSNPNPNPTRARATSQKEKAALNAMFDEFWAAYPNKKAKEPARKAFNKLKLQDGEFADILTALSAHKQSTQWTKDNGQFIPLPATWLNQRRWEDELKPESSNEEDVQWAMS